MSNILYNNGRYNVYSTISDTFVYESFLTLVQLKKITKEKYGTSGLEDLNSRLERAYAKGTSSYYDKNIEETLCDNRCGKNETFMEINECIKKYL